MCSYCLRVSFPYSFCSRENKDETDILLQCFQRFSKSISLLLKYLILKLHLSDYKKVCLFINLKKFL